MALMCDYAVVAVLAVPRLSGGSLTAVQLWHG